MYLYRLYKFNRWAALLCSFALVGFCYLNYKWGLVATPLNQFGMYSRPVSIEGDRAVFQLIDNQGNNLMRNLNFYKRDQVTFYLNNWDYRKSNEHVLAVFTPILKPLQLHVPAVKYGIVSPNDRAMENWFRPWLRTSGSIPITDTIVRIATMNYCWLDKLVQTKSERTILIDYGNGQ